jgi:predicted dehydrogenase
MSRISFGVVGAGWRTEFYMRIAAAAPDVFETPSVVGRNSAKA